MNRTAISLVAVLFLISSALFAGPTTKEDLRAAFDRGEAKVMELLTSAPALLKADLGNGMTALHLGASYGFEAVIEYALKSGLQLSDKDKRGLTPVWYAVSGGRPEMLRKLLALGADLSVKDPGGNSPLLRAAQGGNAAVVGILVDSGFDVNEKSRNGLTPISLAIYAGHLDVVKLLFERGAVLDASDAEGTTPIHRACLNGSAVLHYLLDRGFAIDARNKRGMTPLRYAVEAGNKDGIRALAMRGADVNAADELGETPFRVAVKKGDKEMVGVMLGKAAKLNEVEARSGLTPLHEAAIWGHSGVVEALLAAPGIDKNSKDKNGYTALSYALKHGNRTAADVLRKNGVEDVRWQDNLDEGAQLNKALGPGEASIWYLKNSGWAIKTKSALLVFDSIDDDPATDEKRLANGHVDPEAVKGLPVYVFVSHDHPDHFDPRILEWKKPIPGIAYIFGFAVREGEGIVVMGPREQKTIGPMRVTTIKSNDAGVGFAVQLDGLTIFHAGDHACFQDEARGDTFFPEIDFLADKGIRPDISFFINYFGCGVSGGASPEDFQRGIFYAVDKLKIRSCLPMHAGDKEWAYRDLVDRVAKSNVKLQVGAAANRGDRFFFSKGKLTS